MVSVKNLQPGSHRRGKNGFGAPPKASLQKNGHYLTWMATFRKSSKGLSLPQDSFNEESPILRVCLKKKNQRQLLNIKAEMAISVGTNKRLDKKKKLKGKSWKCEVYRGLWKTPPYSWGFKMPQASVGICTCSEKTWGSCDRLSLPDREALHEKWRVRQMCELLVFYSMYTGPHTKR